MFVNFEYLYALCNKNVSSGHIPNWLHLRSCSYLVQSMLLFKERRDQYGLTQTFTFFSSIYSDESSRVDRFNAYMYTYYIKCIYVYAIPNIANQPVSVADMRHTSLNWLKGIHSGSVQFHQRNWITHWEPPNTLNAIFIARESLQHMIVCFIMSSFTTHYCLPAAAFYMASLWHPNTPPPILHSIHAISLSPHHVQPPTSKRRPSETF